MSFMAIALKKFICILLFLSTLLVLSVGCVTVQVAPTKLRPHEADDLAVVSATASQPFPAPRETIELRVEVENRAKHAVNNVRVVLRNGRRELEHKTIDVQGAGRATVVFSWRAEMAGRHELSVLVDPGEQLAEMDRLNNVGTAELVVTEPTPPEVDLELRELHVLTSPDNPGVLRAVIRNNGLVTVSAPLRFLDDRRTLAVRLVGPIGAGESQTVDVPWPRHQTIRRLVAELNPRYRLAEPNSKNNLRSFDSPVLVGRDLRIEAFSIHTEQIEEGRPRQVSFSFRVVNFGLRAAEPFRIRITPGQYISTGALPLLLDIPGLAAGERVYLSHTIRNPPESFDLQIEVDVDRVVSEDNEVNNLFTYRVNDRAPEIGRWVSIGPRRILEKGSVDAVGRLTAIAIHPIDPSIIYVGARGSGIWQTMGGYWQPIGDALPSLAIAALAVDPSQPATVYAVTDQGLFRTEDAGTTWFEVSTGAGFDTRSREVLLLHPTNSDVLYLTAGNGLWRSRDRGASWDQLDVVEGANGDVRAMDLVMSPTDPDKLFVAMRRDGDAEITGIYQTLNGGDNWRKLTGCPSGGLPNIDAEIRLALSGSKLYASYKTCSNEKSVACGDQDTWTLYRPTNIGCSIGGRLEGEWEAGWSRTGEDAKRMWSQIYAAPDDSRFVYATGTHFWMSEDFGENFEQASGVHVDHHGFVVNPLSTEIVYTASDGGLYRSIDRGRTFEFVSEGILNVEFYDGADSHRDPAVVIGGTQDNGTIIYDGRSTVWKKIKGGDGATSDVRSHRRPHPVRRRPKRSNLSLYRSRRQFHYHSAQRG